MFNLSRTHRLKWKLYDETRLVEAIKNTSYTSIQSMLRGLGHTGQLQRYHYERVHYTVKKFNLDTSHWKVLHIDSENGVWKHYTEDQLVEAIKNTQHRSLQEMLKAICPGVSVSNSHQSARVFACVEKHGLDTSHWSKKRVYHDACERKSKKFEEWWISSGKEAETIQAVQDKSLLSLRMVSNSIGGNSNGNWYYAINRTIKKFDLDISHWKSHRGKPYYQLGYYFVKDHEKQQSTSFIRKKLEEKRGRKCEKCGNTEWMGGNLVVELHHIDGNRKNNLEDNLQLLCLNCHGQTPNYRIRNRRNRPKTINPSTCI